MMDMFSVHLVYFGRSDVDYKRTRSCTDLRTDAIGDIVATHQSHRCSQQPGNRANGGNGRATTRGSGQCDKEGKGQAIFLRLLCTSIVHVEVAVRGYYVSTNSVGARLALIP